jgi:5'-nucleotidase
VSIRHLSVAAAAAALVFAGISQDGLAKDKPEDRGNRGRGDSICVTFLHNNDGESKLISAPGEPDFGGVARFSAKVDQLFQAATTGRKVGTYSRCSRRIALLLSSGDNFLAGPEFNASLDKDELPFFDSLALDYIQYDAFALGNHEFDFGPEILADFIEGFEAGGESFVSANLDFVGEPALQALVDTGRIAPSKLIRRKGVTFGIVGATTPRLRTISSPRNVEVQQNVAELVQQEIDALTNQGAEIIVLISHLQNVKEDLELIPQLRDVDIVIAGGGDELLANPGDLLVPGDEEDEENNATGEEGSDGIPDALFGPYPLWAQNAEGVDVPVVTTSGDYKYVGNLLAVFDRKGRLKHVGEESGPKRVADSQFSDGVVPDAFLQTAVVEPVEAAIEEIANNVIAQSEVALEGRRDPGVRTEETNLGNLLADALLWTGRELADDFGVAEPDVALQNGGGIRNNSLLPAGDFTELNTFQIAPFSNFVSIVPNVSRERFKRILERAVSGRPDAEGRFAQVAGFRFTYDSSAAAQEQDSDGNIISEGNRIRNVVLDDGTVIVDAAGVVQSPDDTLTVATIDFLARGGDGYPFDPEQEFEPVGVSYQQALFNYVIGPLNRVISSSEYPEGGEGRITELQQLP